MLEGTSSWPNLLGRQTNSGAEGRCLDCKSSEPFGMKAERRLGTDHGGGFVNDRRADPIFPVPSFRHPNENSSMSQVNYVLSISYPCLVTTQSPWLEIMMLLEITWFWLCRYCGPRFDRYLLPLDNTTRHTNVVFKLDSRDIGQDWEVVHHKCSISTGSDPGISTMHDFRYHCPSLPEVYCTPQRNPQLPLTTPMLTSKFWLIDTGILITSSIRPNWYFVLPKCWLSINVTQLCYAQVKKWANNNTDGRFIIETSRNRYHSAQNGPRGRALECKTFCVG